VRVSLCGQGGYTGVSHQAYSAHPGQDTGAGTPGTIQTLLPEEEVEFIIIPLGAVRNLLDLNKHWLWRRSEED
jgi:hypothetical protein